MKRSPRSSRAAATVTALIRAGWLTALTMVPAASAVTKPNVVLIVCDDLNDYITGIPGESGHPQARTPHVDRFAATGVAFRRAYSNNPVCAPSRSSFLTGIHCHESGNLFWDKWFRNPVLKNSRTLMEHFRANGYHVAGSGKLMHHFKRNVWTEFAHQADYGPLVYDGRNKIAHPSVPKPFGDGAIDGSFASLADVPFAGDDNPESGWIYGGWGKTVKPFRYAGEDDRDPTPDERNAAWAAERIRDLGSRRPSGKPYFLAVGFIRPHTPLHVPQKYFDRFPPESMRLPPITDGDASDTHFAGVRGNDDKGFRYFKNLVASYPTQEEGLKAFSRAYLASVAAVDDCIGRVIGAVDASPARDHTIVVVTSDHGWQMGQKDYLFKNSPWEESTRIPFVIRAPGVTKAGGVAGHPVSLIDLYPTLVDLCGLKGDTRKNNRGAALSGHSVRPFLEDPSGGTWNGPDGALTMVFSGGRSSLTSDRSRWNADLDRQHWTYRTRDWRYIRYANGKEELYDHVSDPRETTNVADDPKRQQVKTLLRRKLEKARGIGHDGGTSAD
ncbi:MAG: sulfatase [Verrucomicrobiae bacterium]|nr:sulfatase [Verrucomicrobiae bacterium]